MSRPNSGPGYSGFIRKKRRNWVPNNYFRLKYQKRGQVWKSAPIRTKAVTNRNKVWKARIAAIREMKKRASLARIPFPPPNPVFRDKRPRAY